MKRTPPPTNEQELKDASIFDWAIWTELPRVGVKNAYPKFLAEWTEWPEDRIRTTLKRLVRWGFAEIVKVRIYKPGDGQTICNHYKPLRTRTIEVMQPEKCSVCGQGMTVGGKAVAS